MASIESLGIGSGILTADFLDKILEAENASTNLRLDSQQEKTEAQISAYGEIKSTIDTLASSLSALSLESSIDQVNASSSDETSFTATTNSLADTGNYTVKVDQIATTHSLATKQYSSVSETVGTGTVTIKFGTLTYDGADSITGFTENSDTTSFELELDSSNNTLAGVRDAINNADAGVQASLVYDGSGYRLLLSSEESGEDYQMEISVSGDAALQSLAYNQTQQNPANNLLLTQKGVDAQLEINGLAITSTDNAIDEVIRGVTINITSTTDGQVQSLNISRDTSGVVEKVNTFIESYNSYRDIYTQYTDYNQGGLLLSDSTLRTVNNQVRAVLGSIVEGLESEDYRSLADIGIYLDSNDNFIFKLNQSKLEAALTADADNVAKLFATGTEATDPFVEVLYAGGDTKPGTYDVEITQMATQASLLGQTVAGFDFASPVIVGGSNDRFTLRLDGTTSSVTLEHGSYATGDELAAMIQSSVNGTEAFASKGKSLTVIFNDAKDRLEFTSSRYGSNSDVAFTSVDTSTAQTLGIATSGQGAIVGSYFSNLSNQAFAATTFPGSVELTDNGIDFDSSNHSFDLTLTGTTNDGVYSITLDQDIADVYDVDGNLTTDRDIQDVLDYVQSEINAQIGVSGVVFAEVNSANRLVMRTAPTAGTSQSIEITNYVTSGTDWLGLDDTLGASTSSVGISAGDDFVISYSNRLSSVTSGTISVPAGSYETGDELATAIETAINADANVLAGSAAALSTVGSETLTGEDFTTDPVGFSFDFNGKSFEVYANTAAGGDTNGDGSTDNFDAIQDAINTALIAQGEVANDVLTVNNGGKLQLQTAATGSSAFFDITNDGRGAQTSTGNVLAAGIDFTADNASFTLDVDGESVSFTVDGDGSAGVTETLGVIQDALDTALAAHGGGGVFAAGDIEIKLDDTGAVYFETLSKNGAQTEGTFGAQANIQITAFSDTVGGDLGFAVEGVANQNGYDATGLDLGRYEGFDSQATVTYEQDDDDKGRFNISFGADTTITIDTITTSAVVELGLSTGSTSEPTVAGVDVEGTINGVEAEGQGQILTAQAGNESATNGYLLGNPGSDFSSAEIVDATNNTFKIKVDGTDSNDITLTNGAYANGEALAAELEAQINNDTNLKAKGLKVDVQYDDATDIFGIFSFSTGEGSSVKLTEITSGLSNILGLSTTTPSVDGKEAVGAEDDAVGLKLKITSGTTGDRGSVTYVEGVAKTLSDLLDDLLASDGTITNRISGLDDELESISNERTQVEEKLESRRALMASQFAYYDALISSLNSTEDFLVRQFDALASANKKK